MIAYMSRIFFLLLFSLPTAVVFAQNTPKIAVGDSVWVVRQVDSLLQISRMLNDESTFSKSLEASAAAQALALEKLGRESVAYANGCFSRGMAYYFNGNYPEAQKWHLEASAIREKILGKGHPDFAIGLTNLGMLYWKMGKFEKAESLYLEADMILEKTLGAAHPDYALNLNRLAVLYVSMGKYDKAEPLHLKAISIREKTLGKDHPDYARSLTNLATLYRESVNFEKAELLYLSAKAILEKNQGKERLDCALNLNGLAVLYEKMGDYEKAEPLYLEALSIREKTLGKEHPDFAASLNNLAVLHYTLGNYEKAEPMYLGAKDIWGKTLGKEHPSYARTLNNLASLYKIMGQFEKAEPLYLEASAIREKMLGKEHPDFAASLTNLASLYAEMGNYDKAEPLHLRSIDIREKVLGKEHTDYAWSLSNLAIMYSDMGNFQKAEPLYLESKAILEKLLGKQIYDRNLIGLARGYAEMGSNEKADSLFTEFTILNRSLLSKAIRHLSERELGNYLNTFSKSQNNLLAFAKSTGDKKIVQTCFDNTLFYKGFLLNASGTAKRLASANPAVAEKFNQLKSCERRLAGQYAKSMDKRDSKAVAELEAQANDLEKELARTVAGYAENARQVNWKEVQSTLKKDEAAIEFVHFRVNFPKATDSVMYAALLLTAQTEQPVFIPLFEEKALDALLKIPGVRKSDYVNRFYGAQNAGEKTLYKMLWQPLEKELAGVNKVFFSPSGLLHRLQLGAISTPPLVGEAEGAILADRYILTQVGSTRQLLEKQATMANSGGEAALFGGIQFDMDHIAATKANTGLAMRNADGANDESGFSKTGTTAQSGDWAYLNWTEVEVAVIQPVLASAGLETTLFKGFSATEEAFKNLHSPRILHIATHGYFSPDVGKEKLEGKGESAFKISEHPMIRSGLILAGGNHAWKSGSPLKPGMEDGILTAYEISQMDLSNTELVVLSACETGLGDIRGNEGVYGLQRAFKIAGAKYLIMSLWQVPDFQTQELMTAFYNHYLTEKMPLPEAFRVAQHEMREKYEQPYFWAGFVLLE